VQPVLSAGEQLPADGQLCPQILRKSFVLVRRAFIPESLRPKDFGVWPFSVPCVAELAEHGMSFDRPITFLVGENGSGKSTLVEAFAEAYGLDARGGRAGRKYGNDRPRTPLGDVMRLESTAAGARLRGGSRQKQKGYFLRAETAFGFMEVVSGMRGYWEEDTSEMSHGEGFLTVFSAMFREPGLYLMDEPEAALSFTSCLRLVALMRELGESGAQVVCATHSPILAATPGADIIEIGEAGFHRTTWDKLELVDYWRRYLDDPNFYLRHVIDS
jgi:predicted ATPase